MNNHKKLYWFAWAMAMITIILFVIGSIYVEKYNVYTPMIVSGCLMIVMLVLIIAIYIRYVKFICPKCNQTFKPSAGTIFCGIHTPTKRLLKCPHCNTKAWCKDHFE